MFPAHLRAKRQQAKPASTGGRPHSPAAPGRHLAGAPLALAVACLLFSVYLFSFSGSYHSSDEMSMLAATDSLARRGAWDIDLLRWMGEQQGTFGPDGHLYSRKGIGTTLAALPLYWLALRVERLGNVQAAMLTNGLLTSLTGALVLAVARRLGYSRGASLLAALGFGLGTMAWPYARTLFSEPLAALGLLACFYFLVRFRDDTQAGAGGGASLLLAGSGLAVALLARLNNAIVAPFLGLLLVAYLGRLYGRRWAAWLRPLALFAIPVLVSLAIAAWYNWFRFGSPLVTGYLPEESFSTPFFQGLYGLLLSPGKGLIWYNPLLLAAALSWPSFYRRWRAEALLCAAVVLANLAFYAPWYLWWAGHGWGPRFLVAALPFAALSLAPAFEAATRHRAVAACLVVLAVLSLAAQVAGVAVDYNLYLEDIYAELGLYHPATLFDPGYSPLLRQWGYFQPGNLDLAWARGADVDWRLLLLGLAAVIISGIALLDVLRRRPSLAAGLWLPLLLAFVALRILWAAGEAAGTTDVARVARAVAKLERSGEGLALAEPLWTEGLQNTYDGRLPIWSLPLEEAGVLASPAGVWELGRKVPGPAAVRFWAGEAGAALHLPAGQALATGTLPVAALDPAARLGNVSLLLGVQVDDHPVWPGENLPVTLYWQALEPTTTSYTVFIHLVDDQGNKAGQVDGLPCRGACPTTDWRSGELVGERYELVVDPGAQPGSYHLIAGLYDLSTGERLWLTGALGESSGANFAYLTNIEVRQSR